MKHTTPLINIDRGVPFTRQTPGGPEVLEVYEPAYVCSTCWECWSAKLSEEQQPDCTPRCANCGMMQRAHNTDSWVFTPKCLNYVPATP